MPVDIQHSVVLGIVSLAALSIGRRLWKQIAGFRGRADGKNAGACDGCPSSGQPTPPLLQIATRPPQHLRRPPVDGR